MIPHPHPGSPALGFLHELAVDPPRALRRAPTIGLRDVLYPASSTHLRVRGWREVEHRIPEAIRDELALLLAQASQMTFGVKGRVFLDPRDARGRTQVVQPAKWRADAASMVEEEVSPEAPFSAAKMLLRMVLDDVGRPPTSLDLAIASLRLVPRDSTRLMVSLRESVMGHLDRSLELIASVLQTNDRGFLASYAWSCLTTVAYDQGRHLAALDAARRGAFALPTLARGPLNWLIVAIQSGKASEIRLAGRMTAEYVQQDDPELSQVIFMLRTERSAKRWTPTPFANAGRMEASKHGLVAGRIADEFQ